MGRAEDVQRKYSYHSDNTKTDLIRSRVEESIGVKQALCRHLETIQEMAQTIIGAYRAGRKILLFGNGGSAADAQHLAAEFTGRFKLDRPALPATALNANTSVITAIGNDYSFDRIFSRQIEAEGQKGDVAIGITTSGASPNIIAALSTAKLKGLVTLALTGETGGEAKQMVDCCLCVPSKDTARIQECHILIGHILCELVEKELFDEPDH